MAYGIRNAVIQEVVFVGKDLRSGQVIDNVLHCLINDPGLSYNDPVGAITSAMVLGAVYLAWQGLFPNQSSHYELGKITLTDCVGIEIVNGHKRIAHQFQDEILGVPGVDRGGLGGETLPPNCSHSVRKIGVRAGRNWRGSMRLGMVPEAKQSNGALTATHRGLLQTDLTTFGQTMDSTGTRPDQDVQWVVFSKTLALALPTGPWTAGVANSLNTPVFAFTLNPNVGTQRSRKPRLSDLIDQSA